MIRLDPNDARRIEIEKNVQSPVVLLEIDFGSLGIEHLTTAPYDLAIGGNLYSHDSGVVSMSVPAAQKNLSRDFFTVGFESTDKSEAGYRYKFTENGHTGIPVTIKVAYITSTGVPTSTLEVYNGISDSVIDQIGEAGAVLLVTFRSPLTQLQSSKVFLTTEASQARRDAADEAFKYSHNTFNFQWGSPEVILNPRVRKAIGGINRRIGSFV